VARDAVANDLQARDLQLRVQRSFRQEPGADNLLRFAARLHPRLQRRLRDRRAQWHVPVAGRDGEVQAEIQAAVAGLMAESGARSPQ
jgi:hypothetical protein